MTRDPDWLSWPEAADLVGCPVSTVDWYVRRGRIDHRPAHGQRPSLRRESVEEFAVWWAERQAARQARKDEAARRVRAWLEPPEPEGWIDTRQAGAILGVNRKHVLWLIGQGYVKAVKTGRRWWVEEATVLERKRTSDQWISQIDAAKLVGCSPQTILRAAKAGEVEQRSAVVAIDVTTDCRGVRGCVEGNARQGVPANPLACPSSLASRQQACVQAPWLYRLTSMGTKRALSRTTLDVLAAFYESPADPKYGLQLMKATGIKAGSLYPILQRFEDAGWVDAHWEDANPRQEGRPRRRYYTLSGLGQQVAKRELQTAASKFAKLGLGWTG